MIVELEYQGVICTSNLDDPTDYLDGGNPFGIAGNPFAMFQSL